MKKHLKKVLVFGLILINTIAFAFPADPDVTPDPPAPINDYILALVFLGIGFAIWHQYKKAEQV